MKRLFIAIAVLALSACTTIQEQPTPAQVAHRVCPSLQMVVSVLAVPGTVDHMLSADLAIAQPVIATVCSGGLGVKLDDLHDLSHKALPALTKIVNALPIPDDDKTGARIAIALTEAAIGPMINPAVAP